MAPRRGWPPFYYAATNAMKVGLTVLARWEVIGARDDVPSGPLVVVSNHLSLIDPPLLAASLPRRLVFMAKQEAFESRLGAPFVQAYGAFPVRRGQVDRLALREAQRVLEEGHALAMFPEGTRSRDGRMHEGHPGTALVATRNDVPVLPVGLWGSERVKRPQDAFSRPHIVVHIGETFRLPRPNRGTGAAALARNTEQIMQRIEALLPPAYRRVRDEIPQQVAV